MKFDSVVKGNQLLTYTRHLSDLIESYILDTERYQNEFERICYTIVHKLRNLLDASSFLVTNANLDGKPHFIDSSFLILRTCLSDTICLYYILDHHEISEILNKRIERILSDHVRYLFRSRERYRKTKNKK